jgi:hypothetical protein
VFMALFYQDERVIQDTLSLELFDQQHKW